MKYIYINRLRLYKAHKYVQTLKYTKKMTTTSEETNMHCEIEIADLQCLPHIYYLNTF